MKDLQLSFKSTVITLRWLTVLLVMLLIACSEKGLSFSSGAFLVGVNFALTNILLAFIPRKRLEVPAASSVIMLMDIGFVSLAIYLTSGFNTDFYLVYFLVIFIAAIRQELKGSIASGVIAVIVYGWLVYRSSSDFSVLNASFLIRALFLLLIATFSGYLAQRARVNEGAKKIAKNLAQSKVELEKWNLQLETKVRERTQELEDAQERLLRSERLATIGQLAASVGHELRNPLGVLQNLLYLLNLKLQDADEKVQKYLATMQKELLRSDKIVSELLEFSRRRKPSPEPTDLNGVIEEVLSKVSIPQGIEVVRDSADLPTVTADHEQLQSVFLNLISNGIQAMPEGGDLTVKTSHSNGFVKIAISDTGIGIPETNLKKIFDPLFTTKPKGIGLGLSITKNLIENHGGTMDVESTPNKGSTFLVKLPVHGGRE